MTAYRPSTGPDDQVAARDHAAAATLVDDGEADVATERDSQYLPDSRCARFAPPMSGDTMETRAIAHPAARSSASSGAASR